MMLVSQLRQCILSSPRLHTKENVPVRGNIWRGLRQKYSGILHRVREQHDQTRSAHRAADPKPQGGESRPTGEGTTGYVRQRQTCEARHVW